MNKVGLIGRLGRDVELKTLQSGSVVANFTMATSEKWTDKNGEQKEATEWHNCVAWGDLGEKIARQFKKGSRIEIDGKIKTDSYEKNGEKKYFTKIHIYEFWPMDGANNENEPKNYDDMP